MKERTYWLFTFAILSFIALKVSTETIMQIVFCFCMISFSSLTLIDMNIDKELKGGKNNNGY